MMVLVIAGSHQEFHFHLRHQIRQGFIKGEDAEDYIYISRQDQFCGVPDDTKVIRWGQYWRNPLLQGEQYPATRGRIALIEAKYPASEPHDSTIIKGVDGEIVAYHPEHRAVQISTIFNDLIVDYIKQHEPLAKGWK